VRDANAVEVQQPAEHLVGVDLQLQARDLCLVLVSL
jgi:hypothetical protein